MTHDCFGNPTPGIPPAIADTFYDIELFRPIPFAQRYEYMNARTTAMIGQGDPEVAWTLYYRMIDELSKPLDIVAQ